MDASDVRVAARYAERDPSRRRPQCLRHQPATPNSFELLNEAYTKEKQLETALQAHVQVTTRDDYAKRLKDHLKETKSHATQVSRRIKQLGGNPETVSLPGPEGLSQGRGERVGRGREGEGGGPGPDCTPYADRASRTRCSATPAPSIEEEAHEIATYTVIDSLATAVGDTQTAKLARDILRQEERMQQFLAELLPQLSVDVAHDEIPVSEINGQALAPDGGGLQAQELLEPQQELAKPQQGQGLT